MTEQGLPQNTDTERSLLGGLLLDAAQVPEIREVLTPEDFSMPRHQFLFATILRLADAAVTPDVTTVLDDLQRRHDEERHGGVAYIVAHEVAHNVQQEQGGLDDDRRGASARPFELQADCLAGTWGASVYRAGDLQEGDVEEALSTALAVGDFEVGSQEHHGTPEERRDAWLLGFESGDPSRCSAFLGA